MPLLDDLKLFFTELTAALRREDWERVSQFYQFPLPYTYTDALAPIHNVDNLIAEAMLLSNAMRSGDTRQVNVTPRVLNEHARDGHIPVWVDYEIVGRLDRVVYNFTAQFYCEIKPSGGFMIESVSIPFERAALMKRTDGAA